MESCLQFSALAFETGGNSYTGCKLFEGTFNDLALFFEQCNDAFVFFHRLDYEAAPLGGSEQNATWLRSFIDITTSPRHQILLQ